MANPEFSGKVKRTVTKNNYFREYKGEITQISNSNIPIYFKSTCSRIVIDHGTQENLRYVSIQLTNFLEEFSTSSDSAGIFQIDQIYSGKYEIIVSYLGYYQFVDSIFLEIGKNTFYQIELFINTNAIF